MNVFSLVLNMLYKEWVLISWMEIKKIMCPPTLGAPQQTPSPSTPSTLVVPEGSPGPCPHPYLHVSGSLWVGDGQMPVII